MVLGGAGLLGLVVVAGYIIYRGSIVFYFLN
jgi:hypothetical protein